MRLEIAIASVGAVATAALEALPVIDLGYAIQQATLNVEPILSFWAFC